jgi:hypothetical protein
MRYENLKKNDVLFCESKGSRVLKLIDKVDNSWIGRDVFTQENFELSNKDQFKLVNRERKTKPLSLIKLVESTEGPSTLTENEVFIVDYIMDNYNPEELGELVVAYEKGKHLDVVIPHFKTLKRYLNINGNYTSDDFYQYIYCAYENIGKTITTSTRIERFKEFEFRMVEERRQYEYTTYGVSFHARNHEDALEISEIIKDDFFSYDPENYDTDYGDSDFLSLGDPELRLSDSRPVVIA